MAMPPGNSHRLLGRLATAVLRAGGGSGHASYTALRPFSCAHGPLQRHQKFPTSPTTPPEVDSSLVKKIKIPKRNKLPQRPKPPPDSEIEESFLKGSGPGGQKIVRLTSPIPPEVILYSLLPPPPPRSPDGTS